MYYAILAAVFVCTAASSTPTAANDTPIVVIRVDDCDSTWLTPLAALDNKSPFDYAKQHRIPITWAIIVDSANAGGIPWAKLKEYLDYAGGEPASHSYHHSTINSVQAAASELASSKQAIEQHLPGYACTSFVQPGNWYGDAYLASFGSLKNPLGAALQATYDQSMAYVVPGVAAGPVYYRHGLCASTGFDSRWANWTADMTAATLDAIAASPGSMFVFQLHDVGANPKIQITVDGAAFRKLVDRLAELRDAGKVQLMSLRDARARSVSQDVNRIGDPGFEATALGLTPAGPWMRTGATSIATSGGVGNSKYAKIPGASSELRSWSIVLGPGNYELSWCQRPEPGSGNGGLAVSLTFSGARPDAYELDRSSYANTDPNAWERKRALIRSEDGMPSAILRFMPLAGGYGVDDVSLTPAPTSPTTSPSSSAVAPLYGHCAVSWNTPANPSITWICVRSSSSCFPLQPGDGTPVAVVRAVPGTRQDVNVPMDWSQMRCAHFSVFSIMSDGSYSQPDLAEVTIDQTPPTTPAVTASCTSAGSILVTWSSADPESGVASSTYAVGSTRGASDIVTWTQTGLNRAEVSGLPVSTPICVTVRTRNLFGVESQPRTVRASLGGIVPACNKANGEAVRIAGVVTAVFGDCCYVQEPDRSRGIRVTNAPGCREGDVVTITGRLTTSATGERILVADRQP